MKIAALIARYLLGLIFLIFGANKFHMFIPIPPATGAAAQFMGTMFTTHMMLVVAALEVIGALLLLIGRYVPLGLVLLGPIVINIVLFHAFMEPSGVPFALVLAVLWLLVFAYHRAAFAGIFQVKA
jgi:putative oxidoreductase